MKKREIRCGDIYLAQTRESIGHEYEKLRPYLLVDPNWYIRISNLVCMVPLTGNLDNRNKYDLFISRDINNGLNQNSIIKVDHLYTFDKSRLCRYLGFVDQLVVKVIHSNLRKRFNL